MIYLTEVLPEIAPDLIDPETGEPIAALQAIADEVDGASHTASDGRRDEGRQVSMTATQTSPAGAAVDCRRATTILEVVNLKKYFPVKSSGVIRRTVAHVQAVDGVSFSVPRGGSLGLVGESGCGKSTTGRLITRLYEPTGGEMRFEGQDLAKLSQASRCCRCAARSR